MLPRAEELHGENRVTQILACTIGAQAIALLFVLGRVISRVFVIGILGWDDILIVFAWLNGLVLSILFCVATEYGQGYRLENVPLDLLANSFSITYITLILYQLALCFTKLSILVFYLRVFPARRERLLSWGTIIFMAVASIPILIVDILQCNPATQSSFFSPDVVCLPPMPILITSTVVHTILDGWLIIMVIPVVTSLKIPKGQKTALMCVLSLGVLVILASAARLSSILNQDKSSDITWVIADFDIWTVLEVSLGIICASAPAIRPLLQKVFPRMMRSVMTSSATGRSTITAVETEAGGPMSGIELGARNLGMRNLSIGGKTVAIGDGTEDDVEAGNRKDHDSWLSDTLSEEHLVLKGGRVVKKTDTMVTDRIFGLSGAERRDTLDPRGFRDTRQMSLRNEVKLGEDVDGMLRQPP